MAQQSKEDEKPLDEEALDEDIAGLIALERPNVSWEEVVGLDGVKQVLREFIVLPVRFPLLFTGRRLPWRGFLLYGPHGAGKSLALKAAATEAEHVTLLSVSAPDIVANWNKGERVLNTLFRLAQANKPSVVFINEIEALSGHGSVNESYRRVKTEFLIRMADPSNDGVSVVTATAIPWMVDYCVRRRLEKRLYIRLPDAEARTHIFKLHLASTAHSLTERDFMLLGQRSEGHSGSDIYHIVHDALMQPVRRLQTATHFKTVTGPTNLDSSVTLDDTLTPCSLFEPGAIQMDWKSVPEGKLLVPSVTKSDLLMSLECFKLPDVDEDYLNKLEEFTADFGHES